MADGGTKQKTKAGAGKTVIPREMVALADLKPHPRNYRGHSDDQLEHVIESIKANGLYRNVVVAKDLTILAGHAVVEACKRLKIKTIPVVKLNLKPNDARALKLLVGDNEIGALAMLDDRALTEMLKEVSEMDVGLLGTGFDDQMLAARVFTTRSRSEVDSFDAAKEWTGMPEYDPGEQIILLTIKFRNVEDYDKFIAKYKIKVDATFDKGEEAKGKRKHAAAWWPPQDGRHDRTSVKWEEESD